MSTPRASDLEIDRILVAVNDTADAMAAAQLSAQLAVVRGAQLRAVHATANHTIETALRASHGAEPPTHGPAGATERPAVGETGGGHGVAERRRRAGLAVLARARRIGDAYGLEIDTALVTGSPGPAVLHAAQAWRADLVVVGRAGRSVQGEPYVGSQTKHIIEFSEVPVIVVPPP